MSQLRFADKARVHKTPEYLEWLNSDLVMTVREYVELNGLARSRFIRGMNRAFGTTRFDILLKKWLVEYFLKLFRAMDEYENVSLEDSPLNRFGVEKYRSRFGRLPNIGWRASPSAPQRIFSVFFRSVVTALYLGLNRGLNLWPLRTRYKVMREAIWGLYGTGGYHFHDDFFVDGDLIKKKDLILFSRGAPEEKGRLKAREDARKSGYAHFNLLSLPLGAGVLFSRVIPKYVFSGGAALARELNGRHFSLYLSVYLYFIRNGLPYEKVFSRFSVNSELGHSYFSAGHVAEAIVCQSRGTGYYLMHWSDNSVGIDSHILSFLGCDAFLLWGMSHVQGVEGAADILMPAGYVFKRFILEARAEREKVMAEMGIRPKGKVISFFDESFGNEIKMTEEQCLGFWETALRLARSETRDTVVIKPKSLSKFNDLSAARKERFLAIKEGLEGLGNVHVVSSGRWSFAEVIGISDLVVTQGMTSSSTIAIICGIPGLYLDQADYNHPFSRLFKDILVFDEPEKLLAMARKIVNGEEDVLKKIPADILRGLDAYEDDRGIDIFRRVLSGDVKKKVGVIVQARMGSTRLPGKTMKPILGRPMLEILIERLKRCKSADELIVATTTDKKDDLIEELSGRLGVLCFRGDEEDVLNRYYEAARARGLDVIARVTSDCPLMDPVLVDDMIGYYLGKRSVDYASNTIRRTYPRGFDIEVFSFESLRRSALNAGKKYQREHVTPYIYENMRTAVRVNQADYSRYRVTVDTAEDFELVSFVYEALYNKDKDFGWKDVVDFLDSRPDVARINQRVEQKKTVS